MSAPYRFMIRVDGRPYTGDWHLMLDGRLCVRSPWGNDAVDCCAGTSPEPLARKTLERIVRADQARRARVEAQQEREMAKLARKRKKRPGPEPEAQVHGMDERRG